MPTTFSLDPDALLDFSQDWTGWLADGETIISVTVVASDPALTITDITFTGSVVTFWLSTGTDGTVVLVTVHIETSQGREDDRSETIRVNER